MVYVSYSQKDKSIVQRICRNLTEKGICLFTEYEQLVGDEYAIELTKRIEESEAVIFFYSNNTENSTWVKREIEFSLSLKKTIIPVLLTEPKPDGWLFFNLGDVNWISVDRDHLNDLTENIIKVLFAVHSGRRIHTTERRKNKSLLNFDSKDSWPQGSNSFRSKTVGCGCLIMLVLVVGIVYFGFFSFSSPQKPSPSITANPNQDSLLLSHRKEELKNKVDYQLQKLFSEIYNPVAGGNGDAHPIPCKRIEKLLEVDYIPFPKDSTKTRQGQLNAFEKYKKNVYSILKKRFAEMEMENAMHGKDSDTISSPPTNEEDLPILKAGPSSDKIWVYFLFKKYFGISYDLWLYIVFSFLAGVGTMILLLCLRRFKVKNLKLSSDIASKVSIDGGPQKEIKSRKVFSTHLDKGEYLIDFEDKNNKERHKTFNHTVDSNESKLIFADFESQLPDEGKSIKCFIAGSKTLQTERDALRAVTCVMYNKWASKNFRILSYTFEDFERAAVIGGHQKQYNDFIAKEADWALFIIDGGVGGITVEEYRKAMDAYKKNGKPKILALAKVGSEDNEEVAAIKVEINKEHQYWTDYTDVNSMKYIFESTLNWDLIDIFHK